MKKVLHKKKCNTVTVQVHMEPHPIPLIKSNNNDKWYNFFVKTKLCRNSTSKKSDLYRFKMALFDNVNLEEFLFFISNFSMTPEASVTLKSGAKIQYLCTLVRGETLNQFYTLSSDVG